jgi:hypothetical protein
MRLKGYRFNIGPLVCPGGVIKHHRTLYQGVERVIASHTNVAAWVNLGPALTNDDGACEHSLPTKALDTQSL